LPGEGCPLDDNRDQQRDLSGYKKLWKGGKGKNKGCPVLLKNIRKRGKGRPNLGRGGRDPNEVGQNLKNWSSKEDDESYFKKKVENEQWCRFERKMQRRDFASPNEERG